MPPPLPNYKSPGEWTEHRPHPTPRKIYDLGPGGQVVCQGHASNGKQQI